jgi:peptide/nickel transport system ATP-binding protein
MGHEGAGEPPVARRPRTLAALALASTVASLPQTLVLPLLPQFPDWLGSAPEHTAWIATATMLTGAVAAPVLGWLGDRVGTRRVLVAALALLSVGAVVCALASTLPVMLLGRVLQGVAAGLTGVAMAAARRAFTPERVPGAVGVISGTMGIGAGLGVPVAGLVVAVWPWQSVFWLTAVTGLVAAAAVLRWVPAAPGSHAHPFDPRGAVGLTVVVLLLLVPLSLAGDVGPAAVAGGLLAGGVAALLWARGQLRRAHPFVDLRSAAGPAAWRAHAAALLLGFAFFLSFTGTITVSQSAEGLAGSVLDTGLVQLPASALSIVAGPLAGVAVVRLGARRSVVLGALLAAAAFGLRTIDHTTWALVAGSAALVSGGVSFAFAALAVVVMRAAPAGATGAANGLNLLMRQIGAAAAGVAGALVLTASAGGAGLSGASPAGLNTVFAVGGGSVLLAALLVATSPGVRPPLTAVAAAVTAGPALAAPGRASPVVRSVPSPLPPRNEARMSAPLLQIRQLSVEFATGRGPVAAVRDVSLELEAGRTVAIVGESGSGKSTTAAAVNRLLAPNGRIAGGQVLFEGRDLAALGEQEMVRLRGSGIGLVPQDPMSNLDPLQRVGGQIAETLAVHGVARGAAARARAVELLDMVGIPEPGRRARQYPHELSGGMRQRVLIAMALACRPRLLIADEPTSALDVTVQRTILDELARLTTELGTSVLLITHDLELAAERADDVVVMFRGQVVESGPAARILADPQHEYTQRLLAAAPTVTTRPLVDPAEQRGPIEEPGRLTPALLRVDGVTKEFRIGRGRAFTAVDDVSFRVPQGRTVAIVGESGSGKSTTARMVLGLEPVTSGRIFFDGVDTRSAHSRAAELELRRAVQPVFQNPYGSLDAKFTVGASIVEPLRLHRVGDRDSRRGRALELLDQVALPATLLDRYPHELSGGQRQRVAIARALALQPRLVVLDEAVSALDVLVQAQILDLLVQLQRDLGLSYLFISHDLAVVRMLSHEVHVMQRGRVVESGRTQEVFDAPQHAYTRALLDAVPGRGGPADRAALDPLEAVPAPPS